MCSCTMTSRSIVRHDGKLTSPTSFYGAVDDPEVIPDECGDEPPRATTWSGFEKLPSVSKFLNDCDTSIDAEFLYRVVHEYGMSVRC